MVEKSHFCHVSCKKGNQYPELVCIGLTTQGYTAHGEKDYRSE